MNLTIGQLNLLIVVIGDRMNKQAANTALSMRIAIVAALSKEGAEAFQAYIDEVFMDRRVIPVTTEDLSKFGLGKGVI